MNEHESPHESSPDPERESTAPPADDVGATGSGVEEDDPTLLNSSARALDADGADPDGPAPEQAAAITSSDESSDAEAIAEDDSESPPETQSEGPVARVRDEAHHVAVELKRIEAEVRKVLESRDTRRKRKLAGSYRWRELQDDILNWRYGGRMTEETLTHLQNLVTRRNHLFQHLRFLASTRAGWNS